MIQGILWKEKNKDFPTGLISSSQISIIPLVSGLEAHVYQISIPDDKLVLKVWDRDSKPDIFMQYELLRSLYSFGAAVSKPLGWGINEGNNQVLLTSFDGVPISKVDKPKFEKIANILLDIHKFPLDLVVDTKIPRYDFVDYFFPGIDAHTDIKRNLFELVESTRIEQSCLIHGDYNFGNILELEGEFTIIDWTNVQLGDPRYDIAWSVILIWIYTNEEYYSIYRSIFLSHTSFSAEELEKFEAIACLRWILLNRIADLPKGENSISAVKTILMKNKYLDL